jgi:hypothetical protein
MGWERMLSAEGWSPRYVTKQTHHGVCTVGKCQFIPNQSGFWSTWCQRHTLVKGIDYYYMTILVSRSNWNHMILSASLCLIHRFTITKATKHPHLQFPLHSTFEGVKLVAKNLWTHGEVKPLPHLHNQYDHGRSSTSKRLDDLGTLCHSCLAQPRTNLC